MVVYSNRLKDVVLLTFPDNSFVAAVVGGVIGGFVFICIVTGVIIFMTCKRKRSPGQVLTPGEYTNGDFNITSTRDQELCLRNKLVDAL